MIRASRVLPSTPPLSQSVDLHFFDGQVGGLAVSGIHRWPQTSQTAIRILVQPMPQVYHIMSQGHNILDLLLRDSYNMSNGQNAGTPKRRSIETAPNPISGGSPLKAAIYVRVSTPDQHVESQLNDLRELAAQRQLEVVAEYADRGVSGTKARRPGLDALMADARRKKFSVVLVSAFDRVARSTKHFLQVIDELDSLGVVFLSRRENIDTSGPMGRLFLTLISSIAELESDLIGERVRMGMRRAKLEGRQIGRSRLDIDRGQVVIDRRSGLSLTQVAKKHSISRASVCRLMKEANSDCSLAVAIPSGEAGPEARLQ